MERDGHPRAGFARWAQMMDKPYIIPVRIGDMEAYAVVTHWQPGADARLGGHPDNRTEAEADELSWHLTNSKGAPIRRIEARLSDKDKAHAEMEIAAKMRERDRRARDQWLEDQGGNDYE
jgi:hypothetical protein